MRFVIKWALALFNRHHINNLSQHLNIKQLFEPVLVIQSSSSSLTLPHTPSFLILAMPRRVIFFPEEEKNNISEIFQGRDQQQPSGKCLNSDVFLFFTG